MSDTLGLIHGELNYAAMSGYQRIVQIRVTTDALSGSPVTVPITPERARALGALREVCDSSGASVGVIADPVEYEKLLELLLHPLDWSALLRDVGAHAAIVPSPDARVMGIPVSC